MKNFDNWNEVKKNLNSQGTIKFYRKSEIWWCSLGVNVGFEQDGTGTVGERPVIVVKGFSKYVCVVVPLTTSKKKNPYHVSLGQIAGRGAFAIISQVRLVDTRRFINRIQILDENTFEKIRKAIKDML